MWENSARLALPYMQQGQAQKHVTHNEALELLDILVQLTVQDFDAQNPPTAPKDGQVWALGPAPAGGWSSQAKGTLAAWSNGGWLFIQPMSGWRAAKEDTIRIWNGADWSAQRPIDSTNLPALGVNAEHDATNRLVVSSDAVLLSHAGADHRLKVNKAQLGDTASVVFQTDFSGRAELGLAGEDDFSFKVSPNGADWHVAMRIAAADGRITLANGLTLEGGLTLPAGSVTRSALENGAGRSIVGRADGVSGVLADIVADLDHQVLRRAGSGIGFGPLNLEQPAATSGHLPINRGGTGAATAAGARTNLGLGSAAVAPLVGAVSQSEGVPTGAVIERGVNASGEYIRFADGTQSCTMEASVALSRLTTTIQYPAAFVGSAAGASIAWGSASASERDAITRSYPRVFGFAGANTAMEVVIHDPPAGLGSRPCRVTAIGRWF
jgi:hypothetical protein